MTPRDYHPIDDGAIDRDRTVQMWSHNPTNTDQLIDWVGGGETILVNGGPCLILPGTRRVRDRLAGLGDVVVNDDGSFRALPGGELSANYWPADLEQPPPAD